MLFNSCCGSNRTAESSCCNCNPRFCIVFRRGNCCCNHNNHENNKCENAREREREENCCNPCCR